MSVPDKITFEEFEAAWQRGHTKLLDSELGTNGQFDELPFDIWENHILPYVDRLTRPGGVITKREQKLFDALRAMTIIVARLGEFFTTYSTVKPRFIEEKVVGASALLGVKVGDKITDWKKHLEALDKIDVS